MEALWEAKQGLLSPESRKAFFGQNGLFNHLGLDVVGSFSDCIKEMGYAPPFMRKDRAKYWRDKAAINGRFPNGADERIYVFFNPGKFFTPAERAADSVQFGVNPAESRHFMNNPDKFPEIPLFYVNSLSATEAATLEVPWPGQTARSWLDVPIGFLVPDEDGNISLGGDFYRSNVRQDLQANFAEGSAYDKMVFRPLGWVPQSVPGAGGWEQFRSLPLTVQYATLQEIVLGPATVEEKMLQLRWLFGR